jgi:hypothetical protein
MSRALVASYRARGFFSGGRSRLLFALLFGILSIPATSYAQQAGLEWEEPINISNSGGAVSPQIVVVGEQEYLVVWEEAIERGEAPRAGIALASPEGWSESRLITMPFAGLNPTFQADGAGIIHVLWIDGEDILRHFAARPSQFISVEGWHSSLNIGSAVVAYNVHLDGQNGLHMAFITGEETTWGPAGVYFTYYKPFGRTWTAPVPLYLSDYYQRFLGLPEFDPNPISPEPPQAFVDVEVVSIAGKQSVQVSWDNPSLKRIYIIESNDSGSTWGSIAEVQGPDEGKPYSSPRRLQLISHGDTTLRTWQIVESGGSCTQVYQSSADQGTTWGQVNRVFRDLNRCPDDLEFLRLQDGKIIAFANFADQTYLVAWNGEEWSQPQNQQGLTYFIDPMTFNFIEFGCRRAALADDVLMIVGCDLGEGGDIWFTQRSLSRIDDWFAARAGWEQGGSLPIDSKEVDSLSILDDGKGTIHTLMSYRSMASIESISSVIEYAGWEGDEVFGTFPVQTNLPGITREIEMSMDVQGGLTAFWIGSQEGEITYSRTSINEAPSRAGWSDPVKLHPEGNPGRSPGVLWDEGRPLLVYSVPANEARGVYVTPSLDGGQTWGAPFQVFSGADSDCSFVEAPDSARTNDGDLHIIWTCSTLPGGIGPLEIDYTRSHNHGKNWSASVPILEGPAVWSRLLSGEGLTLHLIWVDPSGGQYRTRHVFSQDGGQTWSRPANIIPGEDELTGIAAVADRVGQIHFLQVIGQASSSPILKYMIWWQGVWAEQAELPLRAEHANEVNVMSAVIDSADRLIAAYVGPGLRDANGERNPELVFSAIPVEYPPIEDVEATDVLEPRDAQAEGVTEPWPLAEAQPQSTEYAVQEEGETSPASTSPISVAALAIVVLSALIVVGVMVFRHRRVR